MKEGAATFRVLFLDDSEADAELALSALGSDDLAIDAKIVTTASAFQAAVRDTQYDAVIVDYRMPDGTGLDALAVLRASGSDAPLILVTGTLGDESAVECVKQGVSDYVLKQNLSRLPMALRRSIGEVRDARDRARLERQLNHAQKMDAVGRLAAGVAHDFNNLLTVITAYSTMMLDDMANDDPRRADLQEIAKAAESAASLTHQLLAFSREQVIAPRQLVVDAELIKAEKMMRRMIGEDVNLVTRLGAPDTMVTIDPTQLEQVILNLAVNARDAMPRGGTLSYVTSRQRVTPAAFLPPALVAADECLALSVIDTGTGMSLETAGKIFEPFFTTKDADKGTGLGLATAYAVIARAGGTIAVESTLGVGTTFTIQLPITRSESGNS